MVVPPDSRYYVHASTHAARAQQEYLIDLAEGRRERPSTSVRDGAQGGRTLPWSVAITILVALTGVALWVILR